MMEHICGHCTVLVGDTKPVSPNGGILLANPEVPKFVWPICLLRRQKSWENLCKKKYF